MTISGLKKGFLLADKFNSIAINPTPREASGDLAYQLFTDEEIASQRSALFSITSAGEYELKDIPVTGYKTVDSIARLADLYRISIEGVHILFVGAQVNKLTKDLLESIGEIHVLILDFDGQDLFSQKAELLKEIEPHYLVVNWNQGSIVESFEKSYGESAELTKKFKLKFEELDLTQEEVKTKFVKLN